LRTREQEGPLQHCPWPPLWSSPDHAPLPGERWTLAQP
jgi:hypothetical protein